MLRPVACESALRVQSVSTFHVLPKWQPSDERHVGLVDLRSVPQARFY